MGKISGIKPFENVDAVLFDMDGTLVDFFGDAERALAKSMRRHDLMPDDWETFFAGYVEAAIARYQDYAAGRITRDQMRRRRVAEALGQIGQSPAKVESLVDDYLRVLNREVTPIPGAAEVVAQLATRYRLGVVTNGFVDTARQRLERAVLIEHFEAVVVSEELGIHKPEAAVFAEALRRLGATPDRSAFVGDSLEHDVAGARAISMRAIYYRGDSSSQGPLEPEPDLIISDLRDLLTVL